MTQLKLGRLARAYNPRVPHYSALAAGSPLPPPPPQIDWTQGMPDNLGMMLNDRLGDCTCAGYYHARQVWSFNSTGVIDTQPDSSVLQLYEQACGYNPSKAGEGPGGVEQNVLTYLLNNGAPSSNGVPHKISGFVEVDPRNHDDVKRVIANCGIAYIGFDVPKYIMPDNAPSPHVWSLVATGDDSIIGGHAVILAGYNENSVKVISWGQYYTMTWPFFAHYVDEVYAIADPEWIAAGGKTPAGISLADLEQQMQALTT